MKECINLKHGHDLTKSKETRYPVLFINSDDSIDLLKQSGDSTTYKKKKKTWYSKQEILSIVKPFRDVYDPD